MLTKPGGDENWLVPSDMRIKEKVKTIEDPYTKISKLRPVTYHHTKDWIEKHRLEDQEKTGYIAQEYRETFPNDVREGEHEFGPNEPPMLQMTSASVGPYTTAAVQQLIKDKTALESSLAMQKMMIDGLIGEITKLSNRITKIENE